MRLLRAMDASTVKPPYNGDRKFFRCWQVPFNTCFRYSQVPFKTSLYAELSVKIRSGMKSADIRIAMFYVKMLCTAAG
jgi:hypothetical protein